MCHPNQTHSPSVGFGVCKTYSLLLFALTTMSGLPVDGASVNFWLSNAMNGPEVPTIEVLPNSVHTLDVWARPAEDRKLLGFSLNLVAENPVAGQPGAITFQHVEVHNLPLTSMSATNRHQYVFDSFSYLFDEFHLDEDEIDSFLGVSVLESTPGLPDGGGMGPECDDEECVEVGGLPAWKIATVTFQAGTALVSTQLFLEIGEHGVWHEGGHPTDTSAVFGVNDVEHEWHTPMHPGPDSRGMHMGLPDAMINVVSVLSNADFDSDGDVDGRDFLTWQRGFGVGTTHSQGDANSDSHVDEEDLTVWQAQYGAALSPVITAVPEPTSLAILALVLLPLALMRSASAAERVFLW